MQRTQSILRSIQLQDILALLSPDASAGAFKEGPRQQTRAFLPTGGRKQKGPRKRRPFRINISRGLFWQGADHHDHLAAFHFRHALDFTVFFCVHSYAF